MRKLALWASIALLLFFVVREFFSAEVAPTSSLSVPKHLKTHPPPNLASPRSDPLPLPAPTQPATTHSREVGAPVIAQKAESGGRPKPPPNAVPFEVKGGLVISYGDVLLGKPTRADFPPQGFVEAQKPQFWPGGEIAYSFDPQLPNPERVLRVIEYFNQNTPVRFVPYTNQKDSVVFSPTQIELCLSYVGRIGGHQPIYLDDRCMDKEITHELMHALGFIHEHSRPDRDQFVRVNWDKIEEDKASQFEYAPLFLALPSKGRPFDYQSVMIYDPTDFAKSPGEFTMESLTGVKIAPTAAGISPEDLNRLVQLYAR